MVHLCLCLSLSNDRRRANGRLEKKIYTKKDIWMITHKSPPRVYQRCLYDFVPLSYFDFTRAAFLFFSLFASRLIVLSAAVLVTLLHLTHGEASRKDGEASRKVGEASRNDGEASRKDGEASRKVVDASRKRGAPTAVSASASASATASGAGAGAGAGAGTGTRAGAGAGAGALVGFISAVLRQPPLPGAAAASRGFSGGGGGDSTSNSCSG
jgi:hypothetical protein